MGMCIPQMSNFLPMLSSLRVIENQMSLNAKSLMYSMTFLCPSYVINNSVLRSWSILRNRYVINVAFKDLHLGR
jgi:hypothetical protein